ncbi:MAG TPA: dihydroneopterin aldolase [Actinomycetota bacterium]|jgi:dihydroneopterin aldolase
MDDSRISLTGIRATGRHGANPGERLEAQDFVVDLDVVVSVREDAIDATADYAALADAARATVAGTSFELLETLADAIARSVFGFERVMRVTAVVHKPAAAAALGLDDVSAEAIVG